ncbi:unnamed protein product, partial [Effrenium voratum]
VGLGCAVALNKAPPTVRAAEPPGERRLCVVGEALFDFLPVRAADGKQAFLPRPGGAPLNVCIAAQRLGAKVSFLGALSSDLFGEELYKTLDADDVDLSMVQRLPNPSTLAFVSKPPGSDVRYAFFKENAADRTLTARTVAELMGKKTFGAVHVSMGAVTLQDENMVQAFQEAYQRAHKAGGFTSFDPNLRGPMIKGSPAAYAERVEAFVQHADCIKSSDADIEFLYGVDADLEAVAKKWLKKGPKLVVVTRGPDGATAWYKEAKTGQVASLSVAPPCTRPQTIDFQGNPAPVTDTVGAGDTCMGSLLCSFLGELHDFSAAQLGELDACLHAGLSAACEVYAYARLNFRHGLLLDVLKKRIIEVVKAMQPWHLAMVANGFARLGTSDERFFSILAAEICRKIPEFEGKPLALVANAYARLAVRNRFLLELLGDEAFRRRGELEPQAIALLLNAHSRLQMSNPVLFDYFAQDIPRRVRNHNLQSLCMVASAFAKSRKGDEALFAKIGDHVCAHASELYPRALASLLFAFSEADIRHGVLFYNAPEHVLANVKIYTTDELCMVGRAYSHFLMAHTPLFETISQALPGRTLAMPEADCNKQALEEDADIEHAEDPTNKLAAPKISALVGLLEAYARLTIYHGETNILLCDAIVARQSDLVPALVIKVARACAALSFAHDGVIRLAAQCMTEFGQQLPDEDFDALGQALEDLGVLGEDRHLMLDGGSPLIPQMVGSKPFDEAAVRRLRCVLFAAVTAAAMNVSRAGCDPPTGKDLRKVILVKCRGTPVPGSSNASFGTSHVGAGLAGMAFLIVCLSPPLYQKVRERVRPWVVRQVELGRPFVIAVQRFRSTHGWIRSTCWRRTPAEYPFTSRCCRSSSGLESFSSPGTRPRSWQR